MPDKGLERAARIARSHSLTGPESNQRRHGDTQQKRKPSTTVHEPCLPKMIVLLPTQNVCSTILFAQSGRTSFVTWETQHDRRDGRARRRAEQTRRPSRHHAFLANC